MKGYVNSIESFSTLDGPGIRSVVFLQGCPLRCLYCHNPETWVMANGSISESSDIIKRVSRNLNYISKNGGVTISGGEPTCQIDFLKELLSGFKSVGLHTAVDTSGYVSIEKIEKIIDLTNLFIIDIKHMDPASCRELTGQSNTRVFELMDYLSLHKKDVWVRHVLVKGITDSKKHITDLCAYIKKYRNIKYFELLPYHDMAKEKYVKLGIDYRLKHLSSYNPIDFENIQQMFKRQYE